MESSSCNGVVALAQISPSSSCLSVCLDSRVNGPAVHVDRPGKVELRSPPPNESACHEKHGDNAGIRRYDLRSMKLNEFTVAGNFRVSLSTYPNLQHTSVY